VTAHHTSLSLVGFDVTDHVYAEFVLVQRSGCGLSAIPAPERGGLHFRVADPLPVSATIEIKAWINGQDSNTVLLPFCETRACFGVGRKAFTLQVLTPSRAAENDFSASQCLPR
jgi:hypothetical protein